MHVYIHMCIQYTYMYEHIYMYICIMHLSLKRKSVKLEISIMSNQICMNLY